MTMLKNEKLEGEDIELAEYKSFTMRFLAKHFPFLIIFIVKLIHRKELKEAEALHEFFLKSNRIDIITSKGGTRGFKLLIDQKTALFFYQEEDKFVYDGWEVGKYEEKGKVTIFDNFDDQA